MSHSEDFDNSELPSTDGIASRTRGLSFFGGDEVERRPWALGLAVAIIILIGFIIGTLFTMGILNGIIEIDPKAIKSILKTLLGKS